MAEQKLHLFIRTSLVAPLIGKSQYNKDYEAFIKLLNMNKYFIYNDNDEFDNIFSLVSDYENEIIKKNILILMIYKKVYLKYKILFIQIVF